MNRSKGFTCEYAFSQQLRSILVAGRSRGSLRHAKLPLGDAAWRDTVRHRWRSGSSYTCAQLCAQSGSATGLNVETPPHTVNEAHKLIVQIRHRGMCKVHLVSWAQVAARWAPR